MHDFEYLDRWHSVSDSDLENSYDEEAAALLQRCIVELGDVYQRQQLITRENFVAIARAAITLRRDGSNALSDAILDADECLEHGATEMAIQIYRHFIDSCPSTFYCRIARGQLSKIER
ncbi:MAG: hypothetical protein L0210_06700 [Rhodospirillales bacterium]|nr:hypothetical protein [Rhodospirillales bacterium]